MYRYTTKEENEQYETLREKLHECSDVGYGEFKELDYLCVAVRNRDATLLEAHNFSVQAKRCGFEYSESVVMGHHRHVRIVRFNHWACGWIDYLMVKPDTLRCRKYIDMMEIDGDGCVYDEDAYCNKEWEAVQEFWESLGTGERMDYLKDCELSIFYAKNKDFPGYQDGLYELENLFTSIVNE